MLQELSGVHPVRPWTCHAALLLSSSPCQPPQHPARSSSTASLPGPTGGGAWTGDSSPCWGREGLGPLSRGPAGSAAVALVKLSSAKPWESVTDLWGLGVRM